MTGWRRAAALLIWPAVLGGAAASAAGAPAALEPRSADLEILDEAFAAGRIETAPERPGVTLYLHDLGSASSEWLRELVARYLPGLESGTRWLVRAVPLVLAALFAALSGFALARFLRRRGEQARPAAAALAALPASPAAPPRRGAESWEEEVRRRLERHEIAAAGEALWWWLATVLVPSGPEASWTSRELLVRARRPDLGAFVGRLDRMIYGPDPPTGEDVRGALRELKEAVA